MYRDRDMFRAFPVAVVTNTFLSLCQLLVRLIHSLLHSSSAKGRLVLLHAQ
jgi:hypothetical protein